MPQHATVATVENTSLREIPWQGTITEVKEIQGDVFLLDEKGEIAFRVPDRKIGCLVAAALNYWIDSGAPAGHVVPDLDFDRNNVPPRPDPDVLSKLTFTVPAAEP
jgi:hypothetical protein